MRRQDRREGAADGQRPEEVGLEFGARRLDAVLAEETRAADDAGIVDHERDVAEIARRGRHLLGLGDVEPDRLDARLLDRRGIARGRIDLARAAGEQRLGEGKAEAAIGAGHEGN